MFCRDTLNELGPPMSRRYWVIAPFNSNFDDGYNAMWQHAIEYGSISIGWGVLGDLTSYSQPEILQRYKEEWPETSPKSAAVCSHMLSKFYNDISPGDIVIARWGTKCIAGVGTVTRGAYYDANKLARVVEELGPDYEGLTYFHHLDVDWREDLRDYTFDETVFGIQTLHEISEEKYQWLTEEESESDDLDPEISEESKTDPFAFHLESQLEEFLITNFRSIFQGELEVVTDDSGVSIGQQYRCDAGLIDILARDVNTNDFVVIELKKGKPSDKVLGQTLRYMGWVLENLCDEGQNVRGMIISHQEDPKLEYGLKVAPNISARYYQVDFSLHSKSNA